MLWLICGSALALALVAAHRVRVLARRLERVKQLQWELSYQVERLAARLDAAGPSGSAADVGAPGQGARPAGESGFVPLSSLRR